MSEFISNSQSEAPENLEDAFEQDEVVLEHDDAFHRAAGETVIRALENAPKREKISHPERSFSEGEEARRQHEADEKARDIERDQKREFKRWHKNDVVLKRRTRDEKTITMRGNIPMLEQDPSAATEASEVEESAEARADKLFRYYEANFDRSAQRWATYGVTGLLEKGILNQSSDALLRSGFWAHEEDHIHERLDPNDEFSDESITAETDLKSRVMLDLIPRKAGEVSDETIRDAKKAGTIFAISAGARRDERTGKVVYALPTERSDQLLKFMEDNGVDTKDQRVQLTSYEGFARIIETIKNDPKARIKGLRALDWYFDTFDYAKHQDEFVDTIQSYYLEEDEAFDRIFKEFIERCKEAGKWHEQGESSDDQVIEALSKAQTVTRAQLLEHIKKVAQETSGAEIFPIEDKNAHPDSKTPYRTKTFPSSSEKCSRAKEEIDRILELDPNATFAIGTAFEDDRRGERHVRPQDYIIIRFGYNDYNNVIAIHIGDTSRAMYCWRGKTGDNAEGWRDYFKTSVRGRDKSVKRYICNGYGKLGPAALTAEWGRIKKYLEIPESA